MAVSSGLIGLVHGPAPPDLRRPHAVGDGLPRRGRGAARGAVRRRPASSSSRASRRWRSGPPVRTALTRGPRPGVGRDGHRAGVRAGLRVPVPEPLSGGARQLRDLLFGSFLGITSGQVVAAWRWSPWSSLGLLALAGRPLLFASVDEGVARARGVPTRALGIGFLLLLGMAVAETAQITGALLVFALLVAPPATAQLLTSRTGPGLALSVVLGVLTTWLGLALAYFYEYPVGFYITTVAFVMYVLARLLRAALDSPRPLLGGTPAAAAAGAARGGRRLRCSRRSSSATHCWPAASSRWRAAWSATSWCCGRRCSPATPSATSPSPARWRRRRPGSTRASGCSPPRSRSRCCWA